MSWQHLGAAALFARDATTVERTPLTTRLEGEQFVRHRACVTGAILSATAFLEAVINELFADLSDAHVAHLHLLDSEVQELMAEMWQRGVPRTASYSVVEKFEIALTLARRELLARSERLHADVVSLSRLRNALIHYEPTWESSADRHDFEKRLRDRFAPNAHAGQGNPFWPDKCLGAGCARWAVATALSFADDFFKRLSIPAPYESHRQEFVVEEA